jgi:hypothetical protein
MFRYSGEGGDGMSKLKVVLIFEGIDTEMNCAIPEILDVIKGYGGQATELIKEYTTEAH